MVQSTRDGLRNQRRKLMAREDYQQRLKEIKFKISMGNTLEEIHTEMKVTAKFWQNLVSMLSEMTLDPHSLYFRHHMRLKTRYEQANSLWVRAQQAKDRKTEAAMVALLLKIDESQIDVAEKLGLIKPGDLVGPETKDVYESMSNEQLESEIRRLKQSAEDTSTEAKPILEPEFANVQQEPSPQREPIELGQPPLDAHNPIRQLP